MIFYVSDLDEMGRGRGGGDHCLSKEDKEDKEGIPIPPSKPKIWSMAELAVCKTPPLGSSPLTAAPSLSGGGSPWQQNSGFGGLSNTAGGLMRQNPAAVAAALRTTWNGMNLLGGAATATSSTTMAADLSMGALYSEMTAAGPEEMSGDSQAAGGYSGSGDLRVDETAASPSPHSPLNNSRKLGGGGLHHDSLHPQHHHVHHQQLSTASNNSSTSSHHSPHVIANNSHGLQHHFHSTAYHQHQHHQNHHQSHNHHFGLGTEGGGSGSMMPLSGGGGGYLADRLKMAASSLAASSGSGGGLYEEEDEQDKVPSSLNMQGVYEGNVNKLASSYEAGLSMLTGPCYGDRL
jgi:hypothetical protein